MKMMSTAGENTGGGSRYPFTASQWQELEHQALVYKYIISGMPIPPHLLFTIKTSLDSSSSSSTKLLLHHQPPHHPSIGWKCFQQMGVGMGIGRKIDPEPGRCRRTDGKKWRCSKEAYPDSKYCERHMHRGRNRSRKPVEVNNNNSKSPNYPSSKDHFSFLDSRKMIYEGMKDEHPFFSGTTSMAMGGDSWQLAMSSSKQQQQHQLLDDETPQKVMHHFFDEWPPNDDDNNKLNSSTTQLSISIPTPTTTSARDFFLTHD